MEQFTITFHRFGLIIQSVPAVYKDIFVWIVGPRLSVNYSNIVPNLTCLLAYLLTYFLRMH